jgi:SpoVK/Ycf46/Vps4 family AAA+-type ATPase
VAVGRVPVVAGARLGRRRRLRPPADDRPVPADDHRVLRAAARRSAVGSSCSRALAARPATGPEQITTTLDDVVGIDAVKDDVVRSLNLLPAHRTFRDEMGGTPVGACCSKGHARHGKTHVARAMAREAGVPFLFVSATSFQSMWYGATAKKIRSYFRALRKAARKEGGAIGFIEEIDAIAMSRGGVATGMSSLLPSRTVSGCHGTASLPSVYAGVPVTSAFASEGTGGVVNELLVQLQSFDDPTTGQRLRGWFVDRLNLFLPPHRQLPRPEVTPFEHPAGGRHEPRGQPRPGAAAPGRFDRRVTFELPAQAGRRLLVDHFLAARPTPPSSTTRPPATPSPPSRRATAR